MAPCSPAPMPYTGHMSHGDERSLNERVADVVSLFDEIQAAYIFGSIAEGRAGPNSDLDVGIVLRGSAPRGLKLDVLEEMTRAGLESVDLVVLDDADPVLRFEAVRPNRLAFARPDFDHPSYFSLALRRCEDELHLLRWQRTALKKRLQRAES